MDPYTTCMPVLNTVFNCNLRRLYLGEQKLIILLPPPPTKKGRCKTSIMICKETNTYFILLCTRITFFLHAEEYK